MTNISKQASQIYLQTIQKALPTGNFSKLDIFYKIQLDLNIFRLVSK